MAAQSPAERFDAFVENLSRSGLVAREDVERRLAEFAAERPLDKNDPRALDCFAARFVFDEMLTGWQCRMLYEGKWKGHFFNGYILLGHVGNNELFSYYFARHLESGDIVVMQLTPHTRAKSKETLDFEIVWRLQPGK